MGGGHERGGFATLSATLQEYDWTENVDSHFPQYVTVAESLFFMRGREEEGRQRNLIFRPVGSLSSGPRFFVLLFESFCLCYRILYIPYVKD